MASIPAGAKDSAAAALRRLRDVEAIRELVLCYSRAIDRKDFALLRDLYTDDAIDRHGPEFEGDAEAFVAMIEAALPAYPYTGHHVCNHMVSVTGDEAQGEVYALALHCLPGDGDGPVEDFLAVRYVDNYRRCADGRWRFSLRNVCFDMQVLRPFDGGRMLGSDGADASYAVCSHPLFRPGARR